MTLNLEITFTRYV